MERDKIELLTSKEREEEEEMKRELLGILGTFEYSKFYIFLIIDFVIFTLI